MYIKKIQFIFVSFLSIAFFMTCTKKEQEKQKSTEKQGYGISSKIEGQAYSRINVNYDSLFTVVDQLTEMVTMNPSDINLRKKLVSSCYDTMSNVIVASGRGKPLTNARTPTLAMNYAQKAATIEAYRWAAYIKEWRKNPSLDLGKISMDIPQGQIVSQHILPDSTVKLLVEVKLTDLP